MNRHDVHHCPCPTTMHSVIGDTDDVLSYHKFATFALASVLLVPRAAAIFNATLRRERERKKRHERFVKSYYKKHPREFTSKQAKGERALERLLELVEDRLFFRYQPRTVNTISKKRPPFNPPHWTGDQRPERVVVQLESRFPSSEELLELVRLGYPGSAAFAAMAHPYIGRPDRRCNGVIGDDEHEMQYGSSTVAHPEHPYIAVPIRRTEVGGGFSRDSVLRAIARMRVSHKMRMAVFEVVFCRRFPSQIAGEFGVGVRALNKAATRVRKAIRGGVQKLNKNAASKAVMGIPCT